MPHMHNTGDAPARFPFFMDPPELAEDRSQEYNCEWPKGCALPGSVSYFDKEGDETMHCEAHAKELVQNEIAVWGWGNTEFGGEWVLYHREHPFACM